jgi:ABC-type transport system substrate-binding protein
MKFLSATVLIASLTASASAFSAVAPKSSAAKSSSVDKTLHGVDADPNVFDPTSGENPAVTRNNKDEVWVPQVYNTIQQRACLLIRRLTVHF